MIRFYWRPMKFWGRTTDRVFGEAVEECSTRYLSQFSIVLRKEYPNIPLLYRGEGPYCRITVSLERTTVEVDVRPINRETGVEYAEVGLYGILLALAPEERFEVMWIHDVAQIRPEVERQLRLLAQHCKSILQGDLSDWPKVQAVMAAHEQRSDESRDEWFSRLREEARQAYQEGHYQSARWNLLVLLMSGERWSRADKRLERAAWRGTARYQG